MYFRRFPPFPWWGWGRRLGEVKAPFQPGLRLEAGKLHKRGECQPPALRSTFSGGAVAGGSLG